MSFLHKDENCAPFRCYNLEGAFNASVFVFYVKDCKYCSKYETFQNDLGSRNLHTPDACIFV